MNPVDHAIASGRALLERGDIEAAVAALSGIEHPEAAYLLAIAQTHRAHFEQALDAYRHALQLEPRFDQARRAYARLLVDLERYDDAVVEYEIVLKNDASGLAARYGYATALLGAGQCEAAETIFDALLSEGEDRPEIRFMRARARLELGRVDEGCADLETAFEQQPADYILKTLAGSYWMRGDSERFESLLTHAALQPTLLVMAAELLRQSGNAQRAVALLTDKALGGDGYATLSQCFVDLDDGVRAEAAARQGLAVDANDRGVIANLISALLMQGKAADALAYIDAMRTAEPLRQHWIAYQATAWRMLGDGRYAELVDMSRLVRPYELPVPDGFDTIDAFNTAFAAALDDWQQYATHPLDQSLRQGSQTSRDLTGISDPVIEAYVRALDAPIRDYMRAVGNDAGHPLTARNSGDYRIAGCWSVRLNGNGWHVNHVHPEGWISSAYYVAVPDEVEDDVRRSGWIKFGEPPFACDPPMDAEHWIRPAAGMLVLFPSFLWHGTAPIHDDSTRITAPFDVVPR